MAITSLTPGLAKTFASGNVTALGNPTSPLQNDLMICLLGAADNVTVSQASWTGISGATGSNGTTHQQSVFRRVFQTGDGAWTFTHTAGDSIVAQIFGWRGVDPANPIGAVSTINTGSWASGGSGTVTANGITPTSGASAIVMLAVVCTAGTSGGAGNFASWSGSNPTLTELGDSIGGLGTHGASIGLAWGISNTGAATGSRTVAVSAVDTGAATWTASMIELLPAPANIFLEEFEPYMDPFGPVGDYGPEPFQEAIFIPTGTGPVVFQQAMSATINVTSSIKNQVNKGMSATINLTSSFANLVQKSLSATINLTASIQALKVILKALTATINITASVQKQVNKPLSATINLTGSIVKSVQKALSATINITASLQALKVILKALTATINITGSIQKQVNKPLSATINLTASVSKQVNKALSATINLTSNIQKQINKNISSFINITASISPQKIAQVVMSATVNISADMTKRVSKLLSATVNITGIVNKKLFVVLSAGINLTATMTATFKAAGGAVAKKIQIIIGRF